jgi:hypothetical protein
MAARQPESVIAWMLFEFLSPGREGGICQFPNGASRHATHISRQRLKLAHESGIEA